MSGTEQDTFQSALAALRAGNIGEAEQLLKEVLRTQPRHGMALNVLGLVLIHLGNFSEAESVLRMAMLRRRLMRTKILDRRPERWRDIGLAAEAGIGKSNRSPLATATDRHQFA